MLRFLGLAGLILVAGFGLYALADWLIVTDTERIAALAERGAKAVASMSPAACLALAAPDYADEFGDRVALTTQAETVFRQFKALKVAIESCDVAVDPAGTSAHGLVRALVTPTFADLGLSAAFVSDFECDFAKTGGTWLVKRLKHLGTKSRLEEAVKR